QCVSGCSVSAYGPSSSHRAVRGRTATLRASTDDYGMNCWIESCLIHCGRSRCWSNAGGKRITGFGLTVPWAIVRRHRKPSRHGARESHCKWYNYRGGGQPMEHQHKPETTVTDEPHARELLRRAFDNTARWQPDFKGFTADLTVNINGKETSGPVIVKSPREVSVQLADGDVQKWAQEQLGMIAVHRGPRSFEESDGKYTLTAEEDGHPLGTKLNIHGSHSFYRLKHNRITQINRTMAHPGMTPFAFT